MAGIAMQVSYSDAEIRGAAERLKTFPGQRAHAMYDALGAAGVSQTQLRFRGGVGPDNVKWPLSKRVIKHGGQTLVKSRGLLDSLTHNVLAGDSGVEWGSNKKYAAAMQNGASIHIYARSQTAYRKVNKRGELSAQFVKKAKANFAQHVTLPEYTINIPARPYVGINADDRAEFLDIEKAHLQAAMLGTTVANVRGRT